MKDAMAACVMASFILRGRKEFGDSGKISYQFSGSAYFSLPKLHAPHMDVLFTKWPSLV